MPHRKRPAHPPPAVADHHPVLVLLTVCTQDRKAILATRSAHETLVAVWKDADAWAVGRYVLMPDHIHLFCSPATGRTPLVNWVAYWKSLASRRWAIAKERPLWQKNFWDRQLRDSENYQQKWEYVRANPVRARLVANAEDWPFAGVMTVLTF